MQEWKKRKYCWCGNKMEEYSIHCGRYYSAMQDQIYTKVTNAHSKYFAASSGLAERIRDDFDTRKYPFGVMVVDKKVQIIRQARPLKYGNLLQKDLKSITKRMASELITLRDPDGWLKKGVGR
jgi:hypothetical protein